MSERIEMTGRLVIYNFTLNILLDQQVFAIALANSRDGGMRFPDGFSYSVHAATNGPNLVH